MIRNILKYIIPKKFYKKIVLIFKPDISFNGLFDKWSDALNSSKSYQDEKIFNKVINAYKELNSGKGAYEKDGKLFFKQEFSIPLISIFNDVASYSREIKVLDFGGSLGTLFFQHSEYFKNKKLEVNWSIVEQKHYVDYGKQNNNHSNLDFFYDVKEASRANKPNIIVVASALQYIENYPKTISEIIDLGADFIFLDKTPMYDGDNDFISVQNIPKHVYGKKTSYPMHIFSENKLIKFFKKNYFVFETGYSTRKIYKIYENSFSFKWLILKKC